jgi:hypothetical protein
MDILEAKQIVRQTPPVTYYGIDGAVYSMRESMQIGDGTARYSISRVDGRADAQKMMSDAELVSFVETVVAPGRCEFKEGVWQRS